MSKKGLIGAAILFAAFFTMAGAWLVAIDRVAAQQETIHAHR